MYFQLLIIFANYLFTLPPFPCIFFSSSFDISRDGTITYDELSSSLKHLNVGIVSQKKKLLIFFNVKSLQVGDS